MPLRPVNLNDAMIGQPLAWDLYTASGVLVAGAGLLVADGVQLSRLTSRPLFRKVADDDTDSELVERLGKLMTAYPLALKLAGDVALEEAIRILSGELIALAKLDHDACLGLVRLQPMRDPAARHNLIATLIALDLGEQTGLPEPAMTALASACLTMNISAMRMHAELADGRLRYTAAIRDDMHRHPADSAKLLEASGVSDPTWLAAVRQHHENIDGSGYPGGLRDEEICALARLIRVADFYTAKITGRRFRPSKSPQFAMKQLFGSERGRLDSHVALMLLRRLGIYPPGTLVRLANREVAVVVRKEGSGESAGHVMAFMEPRGRLLKSAIERDTGLVSYAVLDVTEPEPNWPVIDWPTYWGY